MIFMFFWGTFLKFPKRSQKLLMIEQKQGEFWNLHLIPNRVMERHSQFSCFYYFIYFSVYLVTFFFLPHLQNKTKIENISS